MSIRLDIRNAIPKGLDRTASLCLYRVAQEALHNVIAHSQGTQAVVELMAREGDIVLRILDDGIGFDRERVNVGLGLQSMRERVRSVDGSIDILSSPKMGTRIEVRVPIGRSKVE